MGTAPWTPAALGALDRIRWDFLDATSVTVSGGKASQVTNKGSLGSPARLWQTDAASQPSYANGVLSTDGNGQRVVTDNVSWGSIFAGLQTGTFYGIVKFISGTVWLKFEDTSSDRFGFEGASRVDWPNDNTSSGSIRGFSPDLTSSRIIVVQKTTTTLIVRINGTVVASQATTASNTNSTHQFSLGANDIYGGLPAAIEARGRMGLIDDATVDTAQRLEGWLAWGMSDAGDSSYVAALPANHPYKAAAPTVTTGGTSYALAAAAGAIVLTGRSAAQSLRRGASAAAFTLTGRPASQVVRRSASPSLLAITGRSAAQSQSRSATRASYALTGGQTSTARARTLLAGVGLFALTGGTARQAQGRSASPGTFTVTGQPIAQGHIFTLACGVGSVVVAGQAASRSLARFGSAAAVTVTGIASAKAVGRQASLSTRTLTGGATSRGLVRASAPAVFAVTGPGAARALNLAAPSSAMSTVTGRPTNLASGRFAAPGTFVLNGVAAGLRSLRGLAAGPGTFGMTGYASGYTNSHVSGYTLGAASGQYTVAMYGDGSAKHLPFMKRKRVRFGLSP